MAQEIGRLEHVGIGVEGTSGTATTVDYWLQVLDKDFDDRAEIVTNESATGVIASDSAATIMKQWSDGGITSKVMLDSVGAVLTAIFGASPSSSTSSGETTHTYDVANTTTGKTLTVVRKDSNQDLAHAGVAVNSAQFTWEVGQYFQMELDLMGKKGATATSTAAYAAEAEFAPSHSVIKLASTQSGLDAAGAINVRSATLSIEKNVEDKQYLGSKDISAVHTKNLKVTGTLEVYYDSTTYKDFVFNETERAVRLSVVNTDVDLANSSNPHLIFDLYRVRFSDRERQAGNDDVMMETVNFTGLIDFANSQKVITAELLNEEDGTDY